MWVFVGALMVVNAVFERDGAGPVGEGLMGKGLRGLRGEEADRKGKGKSVEVEGGREKHDWRM